MKRPRPGRPGGSGDSPARHPSLDRLSKEPHEPFLHPYRGRAPAQPQKPLARHPPRRTCGRLRPFGIGQIHACVRHRLCGRPAPVCGIPFRLRPPVPPADGQAGRRQDRGPFPRHLAGTADHGPQPALHGRHRHRSLRLPARLLRPPRQDVLPQMRTPHRGARRR